MTAGFLSLKSVVRRSRYYSQDKENTAAVQRKPAGRRAVMKEEGGGELERGVGGGCNLCVCHIGSQERRMGGRVEAREKGTCRDSLRETQRLEV